MLELAQMQSQLSAMMGRMGADAGNTGLEAGDAGVGTDTVGVSPQHCFGAQSPTEQFNKLIGPTPQRNDWASWNRWPDGDKGDRDPVPKWDGKNPGRNLKPWLRELRIWRQETSIPVHKHGLKLFRNFEQGTWMRAAAERIGEDKLFTEDAW